jgi:hypothetical protein
VRCTTTTASIFVVDSPAIASSTFALESLLAAAQASSAVITTRDAQSRSGP